MTIYQAVFERCKIRTYGKPGISAAEIALGAGALDMPVPPAAAADAEGDEEEDEEEGGQNSPEIKAGALSECVRFRNVLPHTDFGVIDVLAVASSLSENSIVVIRVFLQVLETINSRPYKPNTTNPKLVFQGLRFGGVRIQFSV